MYTSAVTSNGISCKPHMSNNDQNSFDIIIFCIKQNITVFTLGFFLTLAKLKRYFHKRNGRRNYGE